MEPAGQIYFLSVYVLKAKTTTATSENRSSASTRRALNEDETSYRVHYRSRVSAHPNTLQKKKVVKQDTEKKVLARSNHKLDVGTLVSTVYRRFTAASMILAHRHDPFLTRLRSIASPVKKEYASFRHQTAFDCLSIIKAYATLELPDHRFQRLSFIFQELCGAKLVSV
jgi:hypothetical protein